MNNGIKTTASAIHDVAQNLAAQGLCNSVPMGVLEWFRIREGQDYTRIMYSQGKFGIISEIYYLKGDKKFAYI